MLSLAVWSVVVTATHCGRSDAEIWKVNGSANFDSEMSQCGKKCRSSPSCMTACVEKKENYTAQCANCFGAVGRCTRIECVGPCIKGETSTCRACVTKYCIPDFISCSGFTPPTTNELNLPAQSVVNPVCSVADRNVWRHLGAHEFTNDLATCTVRCSGKVHCMETCIGSRSQYSPPCVECFAHIGRCASDKCMGDCDAGLDKCEACLGTHCMADFFKCTLFNTEALLFI